MLTLLVACSGDPAPASAAPSIVTTPYYSLTAPAGWKHNDVEGNGAIVYLDPVDADAGELSDPNPAISLHVSTDDLGPVYAALPGASPASAVSGTGWSGEEVRAPTDYGEEHTRVYTWLATGDRTLALTTNLDRFEPEYRAVLASLRLP